MLLGGLYGAITVLVRTASSKPLLVCRFSATSTVTVNCLVGVDYTRTGPVACTTRTGTSVVATTTTPSTWRPLP